MTTIVENIAEKYLTKNARIILEKRYLKRDEDNNVIETPDELYWRVARHIARGSENYGASEAEIESLSIDFYNLMASNIFLPNSPTLVNTGTAKGCLSACFTRSPDDNLPSIMNVAFDAAMIEKWGGGIGFSVSNLREKDSAIGTTHGKALGAVETLNIYSYIASKITQGSFRLGAHMGLLSCSHPEILSFIHCKDSFEGLKNFNISVQIPDSFIDCLEKDGDWNLISPTSGKIVSIVKSKDLWNELCESAWKTGDPGVAFMDRVWETAPNPQLGKIISSNPCAEEWLEDGSNCCLGSINLGKFIDKDKKWDLIELEKTVRLAVLFLDNVIEVNKFPEEVPLLKEMNLKTRRIGLGVMGWADVLINLGIKYDSEEALRQAERVGAFIERIAWDASFELAKKRGPFPEYEYSALKERGFPPVRNSSVITIAPTGSISRIANCSSGIEPLYSLAWYSNILWEDQNSKSTKILDCPTILRKTLCYEGKSDGEINEILEDIIDNPSNINKYAAMIYPSLFRTALEVSPEYHVKMQAAWQKNTTNAVSKTINMPNKTTPKDISDIYLLAWKLKCKGITVYREGIRDIEVLSKTKKLTKKEISNHTKLNRPRTIKGVTTKINTAHGSLYVTSNQLDNKDFEIFSTIGKAGKCDGAFLEAISRLISLALQHGISKNDIIEQLKDISCCPMWDNGSLVKSPVDGLAITMGMIELNSNKQSTSNGFKENSNRGCKKCGKLLIYQGGCEVCINCGDSKCG